MTRKVISMNKHYAHKAYRCIGVVAVASMIFAMLAACGTSSQSNTSHPSGKENENTQTTALNAGNVAIFTPENHLLTAEPTSLTTWSNIAHQLTKRLKKVGFHDNAIVFKQSSSLQKQSQDVQDYVVKQLALGKNETTQQSHNANMQRWKSTTLIVAPYRDANMRQMYGDLVSLTQDDTTFTKEDRDAEVRLASSLNLAKKAGMHVITLSHNVKHFTPDATVNTSSAEQIGQLQATALVHKLAIDRASKDNPKAIEILLPRYSDKDPLHLLGSNNNDDTNEARYSAQFNQYAFKGIWKVLKPYVVAGKLISPSGMLHPQITEHDWSNFVVQANDQDNLYTTLQQRLQKHTDTNDKQLAPIDGIIALTDNLATDVSESLEKLGYQGSAADINPSITIADILGSFLGKRNLTKKPVPHPARTGQSSSTATNNDTSTDAPHQTDSDTTIRQSTNRHETGKLSWPIITGFGAFKRALPNIVNGKQWMTSVENQRQLVEDVSLLCKLLNTHQPLNASKNIREIEVDGKRVATIQEPLLAISATNLKSQLIDPGYVTLAEVGL